jgi:sensor histidine kinase YesM
MFSGDLENKFITPMLFQPFIENAFKHGASKQVGQVWIDIRLTVLDNQLEFIVTNSAAPADRAPASGGIGIANIHRRLQLLYPDRHRFVREQQEGMYSIALTIELPARPKVRSIVRPFAAPAGSRPQKKQVSIRRSTHHGNPFVSSK